MQRVSVQVATPYEIVIDADRGAEARMAAELTALLPNAFGLVSDSNVGPLHAARIRQALEARGAQVAYVEVAAGEPSKSLSTVEKVAQQLVTAGLTRKSALLALGGGVVGDLTGFVASIFLRGVPFAQLPTTLLAQVDSSVGGKTAVDLPAGKNLVGSFWQPKLVYADLTTLETLPLRELSAGLAELLKHGVIADRALFERIERDAEAVRGGDLRVLGELVAWSCRIKAEVVAGDERETASEGGRALLNFGHTVGHAIEAASFESPVAASPRWSDGPLKHGEAIALGMLAAARLGARLGVGDRGLEARLLAVLPRLGLPIDLDPWLRPDVLARVSVDKKRAGASLKFVVVPSLGEAKTVAVTPERIAEILLTEESR